GQARALSAALRAQPADNGDESPSTRRLRGTAQRPKGSCAIETAHTAGGEERTSARTRTASIDRASERRPHPARTRADGPPEEPPWPIRHLRQSACCERGAVPRPIA